VFEETKERKNRVEMRRGEKRGGKRERAR